MPRPASYPFRSADAKAEYEAYSLQRARAWPVPFEPTFIDTPAGRTFARVSGRPGDPPLVLLPGFRTGSLMWAEMIGLLSARHRTYALDISGDSGYSVSRREIGKWSDYATWLDEVLAVLVPSGTISLMGFSLGGAIAAQYAVRHPERVRSVVLVAPAATVLPFSLGLKVRFGLLALPIGSLHRRRVRPTLGWMYENARRGDSASRARFEGAVDEALRIARVFELGPPPWPVVLTDAEWRDFQPPCLFLVGEHEKIYSGPAALRRLHRVAPQVTAEIVPGAGHDLTLVRPRLVAERSNAFFAALPLTAGPQTAGL